MEILMIVVIALFLLFLVGLLISSKLRNYRDHNPATADEIIGSLVGNENKGLEVNAYFSYFEKNNQYPHFKG